MEGETLQLPGLTQGQTVLLGDLDPKWPLSSCSDPEKYPDFF